MAGLLAVPAPRAEAFDPRTFVEADSVLVHGTYPPIDTECVHSQPGPLHLRLPGRVEVGRADDGTLFVVNQLPFETYLSGIAEVPRDWPAEALRAQVIAARTYALGHLGGDPDGLGYDLCATDACQVYRGMQVSHGPWGGRWRAAVADTAGQALLYEGRPAATLYFSTSNGRTYGNEEVFDGAGPLPYLRGVPEDDDGASPLAHWTASIPLADVGRFLHASGDWPDAPVAAVTQDGEDLVIRGGGHRVRLSKSDVRIALNDRSVCLSPDRYPGDDLEDPDKADPYHLPQTIPSKWFDARTDGARLVVDGRGWGHGVGMVQWGAYGKARRGLQAGDILAAYYGGLRPQAGHPPVTIRVLVAEGLASVTLVPDGTTRRGDRLAGDGPWKLEPGTPLRVTAGTAPDPVLQVAFVQVPASLGAGRTGSVTATASAGVLGTLELVEAGGAAHALTPAPRPHARGDFRQLFSVGPEVPEGAYRLRGTFTDGVDTVRVDGGRIRVPAAAVAAPSPSPSGPTVAAPEPGDRVARSVAWRWLAGILALLGLAGLALARVLRRA